MYQHQFGRIGRGTTPSTMGGDMGGGFDPRSMSMSQIGTGAPSPLLGTMAPPSPAPYPGAPVPTQPWNHIVPPGQQWGSQEAGGAWQQPWEQNAGPMPGMMPSGRSPGMDMQRRSMGAPGSPQGMKTAMGGTNGFRGTLSGGVRA